MGDIVYLGITDNLNRTATIAFETHVPGNWTVGSIEYGTTVAYGKVAGASETEPGSGIWAATVTPDELTFHYRATLHQVSPPPTTIYGDDDTGSLSNPVWPTFTNPTGKTSMLFSFNQWLTNNVPALNATDFTYSFLQQLGPQVMPRVEVTEYQYPTGGQSAFGGVIFPAGEDAPYQQRLGKTSHVLMELNIYADQAKGTPAAGTQLAARQKISQIRDRLVYGLENAGVTAFNGQVSIAPIPLLDANSSTDTGTLIRVMTEEDNWLMEQYFPPSPDKPGVHRQQLLVKLEWYEMRN